MMLFYYDLHSAFYKLLDNISMVSELLYISDDCLILSPKDYILLSTYHSDKPSEYTYRQIRKIRALGHQCIIGLLTFEEEFSLFPKLDTYQGLQIFRLPLMADEIVQNILYATTQIPLEEINCAIEKSQEAYLNETLQLLKHGKELELLNTTLNPLRAMSLNVLTGISTMEKWNTLKSAILYKLQNNPEYSELFLIAERTNNSHQKHYPVKIFFNRLFLSLNKQTDISEMKSFVADIDALIFDFDSLFR